MSTKGGKKAATPAMPDLDTVAEEWALRRPMTGSGSGCFNLKLLNQTWNALWVMGTRDEWHREIGQRAATGALRDIAPRDPLEGMSAAQMIVVHDAALECFRRAHLPEQTFEGRQAALGQANKLVRSYTTLLEALDRHRGKGQPQVVRVERVTVEAGGQAIVGAVSHPGVGMSEKVPNDPMHQRLSRMNQAPRCGARTRSGSPCRSPAVKDKHRCRMHGAYAGPPQGNRNAWRHGGWSTEALALRRQVSELLRESRKLAEQV